ncbi:hypothetical protein ACLOJK_013155 [Asimina triloba]
MAPLGKVKLLEVCRVSPPTGSVADTSLPLTCFDVIWLQLPPVQRLFFYHLPPKPPFLSTTHLLNSLKHSLSLALRLFYPLAGRLTADHVIRYVDGDSVSLSIATSDADFPRLVSDYPRAAAEFHPLVPKLHVESDSSNPPLLALQITVFPNSSGICIGTTTHHAAADGSSSIHFMKSWAAIFRSGDESLITSPPFYDRSAMTRPLDKLRNLLLDDLARIRLDRILEAASVKHRTSPVRATYQVNRAHIELIRQHVSAQRRKDCRKPLNFSPYTLTCAYVWVCLLRAGSGGDDAAAGRIAHFAFPSGCRARLQPPIPGTYFGNCLAPKFVQVARSDLCGEDGVGLAAEAIWREIEGLDSTVLEGAEGWVQRAGEWAGERVVTVAGSPKIRVYDTDFGWGKPKKVEIISIEETGAIALAESREGGGFEVGLVLPKSEMERFACLFDAGLRALSLP